jgi:hypothetical protein
LCVVRITARKDLSQHRGIGGAGENTVVVDDDRCRENVPHMSKTGKNRGNKTLICTACCKKSSLLRL